MGKRCKQCKVPLEGFMYKLIASTIFGIKPSSGDPEICNKCDGKTHAVKGKLIGKVTHYYGHLNVGIIELSDVIKVGDRIHFKGHTSDFAQGVKSMQIEHANVSEGKPGELVGIKTAQKVHPNDEVYKV
jgi:putative protease